MSLRAAPDSSVPRNAESNTCMVVMYHYVRDSSATPFPEIRALAPELFVRQLDWLQAHYTIVTIPQLEAALDGNAALPSGAALLTFDDGFVDHYETVFPVLRERGLSAAFFVSHDSCGPSPSLLGVHKTHFLLARLGAEAFGRAVIGACEASQTLPNGHRGVFGADRWEEADDQAVKHLINYELPFAEADRVLESLFARHIGDSSSFARGLYLDARMIREMADAGMAFGYHTRSHRMLSRLSASEQSQELRDGVQWIRGLTGQSAVSFCYPWGGTRTYTRETLSLLDHAGYSLAFNTVRRRLRLDTDGRYELPRFDTRDLPPYTRGEEDAIAAAAPAEDA
jgi:peptidoglycan/xylan/chitin deacetylase (PgdA/CDA1 family)